MKDEEKKVLHVITGLNDGGAEGVLARLCLHSKAVNHIVVSMMDQGKYGPVLMESGIPVYCLGMNQGKFNILKLFSLVRLIKNEKPSVVQTWMYHADLLGGIAARLAGGCKVFWGIRHSTFEKGKSKRSTIIIAHLCALISKFIPARIVCCASSAFEAHKEVGYFSNKMLVIPNGYDLSKFKVDSEGRSIIRNEFSIPDGQLALGMVGRYDPQKDHSNFLRALSILSEKGIKFKCLLVGRGLTGENSQLTAEIDSLGLKDVVILAGQRNDIPSVMNALDIHVLSSAYGEGFPNVLAEAMACGTPCVSTNIGDSIEIIGEDDLCFAPRDPEALANSILKLVCEFETNPEQWESRRKQCQSRISDRYSIEKMVGSFERCWLGE